MSGTEKKRRGMPLGRIKGYTSSTSAEKRGRMLAKKPDYTILHGLVGRVPSLFTIIDDALKAKNWNWVTLATAIPCSRQYIVDLTDKDIIPHDTFLRICSVLDLDAKSLIRPLDED